MIRRLSSLHSKISVRKGLGLENTWFKTKLTLNRATRPYMQTTSLYSGFSSFSIKSPSIIHNIRKLIQ